MTDSSRYRPALCLHRASEGPSWAAQYWYADTAEMLREAGMTREAEIIDRATEGVCPDLWALDRLQDELFNRISEGEI